MGAATSAWPAPAPTELSRRPRLASGLLHPLAPRPRPRLVHRQPTFSPRLLRLCVRKAPPPVLRLARFAPRVPCLGGSLRSHHLHYRACISPAGSDDICPFASVVDVDACADRLGRWRLLR